VGIGPGNSFTIFFSLLFHVFNKKYNTLKMKERTISRRNGIDESIMICPVIGEDIFCKMMLYIVSLRETGEEWCVANLETERL
jgi:hypothetical protein